MRLAERYRVKDLLGKNRADAQLDSLLNGLLEQVSAEAEYYTRRKFLKAQYTEFLRSYEQTYGDPNPQFLKLSAFPVDVNSPMTVKWSPAANDHDVNGIVISATDYELDAEQGWVKVFVPGASALIAAAFPYFTFTENPRGFKVVYTGGAPLPAVSGDTDTVTLDREEVPSVPEALKNLLAAKVAKDYKEGGRLLPWTAEEIETLRPFDRGDGI